MQGPEKNSYKEFDNGKKFLRLENSPPPLITFLMVRPLAADHLTFEAGVACCEQQTYVRSTPLSLRKITFRRERSDDRKYVCCSQARNGLVVFCSARIFFPRNLLCGIFFTFSMLCGIFFSLLTSLQDFFPQKRSVQVFVKMYLHSHWLVYLHCGYCSNSPDMELSPYQ